MKEKVIFFDSIFCMSFATLHFFFHLLVVVDKMVRLIMISRTRDALLLCASMDNDNHARELEPFKKRARQLIQSCIGTRDSQATNIEDPPLYFL